MMFIYLKKLFKSSVITHSSCTVYCELFTQLVFMRGAHSLFQGSRLLACELTRRGFDGDTSFFSLIMAFLQ